MGVPVRAFQQKPQGELLALPKPEPAVLAKLPAKINVSRLNPEQKVSVYQASEVLLHGPADSRVLAQPGYKQIVAAMVAGAKNVPAFLAKDLVVCDGDTVDFSGFAVLYFNNVIVQGSGQIKLGNNTKLHAYQVKRI